MMATYTFLRKKYAATKEKLKKFSNLNCFRTRARAATAPPDAATASGAPDPTSNQSEDSRPRQQQLPDCVVQDILLRLPAKSLVRFRSMNKSMDSMISDPSFVHMHSKHSQETRPLFLFHDNILDTVSDRKHGSRWISHWYSEDKEERPGHRFMMKCKVNDIIVSPFGLICFFSKNYLKESEICVCNPTSGKAVTLPKYNRSPRLRRDPIISFGFGYIHSLRTYVVIRLFFNDYNQNGILLDRWNIGCEILELSNDSANRLLSYSSWRSVEDKCPFPVDRQGFVFVNGQMFWKIAALAMRDEDKSVALSLDVVTDKFKVLNGPDDDRFIKEEATLMYIDDKLGIATTSLSSSASNLEVIIWVLQDQEHSIWQKKCTIDFGDTIDWRLVSLEPTLLRGNEFVMQSNTCYLLYNMETRSYKFVEGAGTHSASGVYCETLFSLS